MLDVIVVVDVVKIRQTNGNIIYMSCTRCHIAIKHCWHQYSPTHMRDNIFCVVVNIIAEDCCFYYVDVFQVFIGNIIIFSIIIIILVSNTLLCWSLCLSTLSQRKCKQNSLLSELENIYLYKTKATCLEDVTYFLIKV